MDFYRNPRNQVLLILFLLGVSGFYLWWDLRYTVRAQEMEVLRDRSAKLTAMNEAARKAIGTIGMERVRLALDAFDRQEASVQHILPSDSAASSLLPVLAEQAREHDITLQKLTPQGRENDSTFVIDRYEIALQGAYHDVGAFLSAISRMEQIVHVRDFRAGVGGTSPQRQRTLSTDRRVTAEMIIEAYMKASDGTLSAQADAQAEGGEAAGTPSVRYERGTNGQLWQLISVPNRNTPMRIPVPENKRVEAEAALRQQGSN